MTITSGAWRSTHSLLSKLFDSRDWQSERIRALEDRVASLDGGPDSDQAKADALAAANKARVADGRKAIG